MTHPIENDARLGRRGRAWPAEFRAVVGLLRCALGTADTLSAFAGDGALRPGVLNALLGRHRIGAFLRHRLPAAERSRLPAPVQAHLDQAAQETARRALVRSAELVRLSRILGTAGVPFLSVKGPLLAQSLYGGLGGRHAGDLDLFIRPDQLAAVDQALRGAGCRRSMPDFELTPRQWREFLRLKHEFEYFNDTTGVRIEVEWRLAGLSELTFADEQARGESTILGGEKILRLPQETEFLYLFTHGAGHGWFRLFWLVDVALLLQRQPHVDWPRLMKAARQHGVETAVWQGTRLAEVLLGVPLPAALRVPAARETSVRWLASKAVRALLRSDRERAGVMELFRQTRYQWHLSSGWSGKAALLRPRLMSPTNWQALPLPDRWFGLYYAAAPFLWVRRRLGLKPRTR